MNAFSMTPCAEYNSKLCGANVNEQVCYNMYGCMDVYTVLDFIDL